MFKPLRSNWTLLAMATTLALSPLSSATAQTRPSLQSLETQINQLGTRVTSLQNQVNLLQVAVNTLCNGNANTCSPTRPSLGLQLVSVRDPASGLNPAGSRTIEVACPAGKKGLAAFATVTDFFGNESAAIARPADTLSSWFLSGFSTNGFAIAASVICANE